MNRPPGRGSTPGALIKVPIKKSNGRGNGKLAPPAPHRAQSRQLAQAKGNISVLNRSQASRNAPCSSWSSEAPPVSCGGNLSPVAGCGTGKVLAGCALGKVWMCFLWVHRPCDCVRGHSAMGFLSEVVPSSVFVCERRSETCSLPQHCRPPGASAAGWSVRGVDVDSCALWGGYFHWNPQQIDTG